MSDRPRIRLFLAYQTDPGDGGGGNLANRVCADVLRSSFDVVDHREDADLQVISYAWDGAPHPARLFIDHGSFADAGFWAFRAPGLTSRDTVLVASSVCQRIAQRFIESGGPSVVTVPLPIDTEQFSPAVDRQAVRRGLRDEHGIPDGGPLLLVAAGFVRRKNHHLALRVFGQLLEQVPEARLAVVGSTPNAETSRWYRAAVSDLAVRLGIASRVQFLGPLPRPRLARLMSGADLLLHLTTCRIENFGLVVAEAMAAGLPVAASDWGGLRDLVSPGGTGLLARTYLSDLGPRVDWRSLVGPAGDLLRDADAWTLMSRRARERAVEQLGLPAYSGRLRDAIAVAFQRSSVAATPPVFSPGARELMFRTTVLNAMHREIRDAGDEFRLLMPLDGGSHYRFLAGPAATSERPPIVQQDDHLYPVAAWHTEADDVVVSDEAWPSRFHAPTPALRLLQRCDGTQPVRETLELLRAENPEGNDMMRHAQWLVDRGVLCPLDRRG